ncbi:MAG TPA: CrcB family protein [Trebonia sp.]|nr:CrcB family protein [Trebonia sp.]
MPQERPALADVRLLAAVSCGGVLGALARYGVQTAYPHSDAQFGWATFAINVSGCLLIGIIAVLIAGAPGTHRLVRPFLVTGVLGGYTTFSTYIVDIQHALLAGAPRTALLYGAATVAAAIVAAWAGLGIGDAIVARWATADEVELPGTEETS